MDPQQNPKGQSEPSNQVERPASPPTRQNEQLSQQVVIQPQVPAINVNVDATDGAHVYAPIIVGNVVGRDINAPLSVNQVEEPVSPPTQQKKLLSPELSECQKQLKSKEIIKCHNMFEGIPLQGKVVSLKKLYTEVYIIQGEIGEVNKEHEVRQMEIASKTSDLRNDNPIECTDIFKPLPEQQVKIRTVLTKGVAGIGKTVSVQKFTLDWAEGEANKGIDFLFSLPFRELNRMKDDTYSLVDLIGLFHNIEGITFNDMAKCQIAFIFDGLDESRLPLNFKNNKPISSPATSAPLDVILTNLIKGNLLPSALVWITSRPAAANQIPAECVQQVTEVRGFTDPKKEEYFLKRIGDKILARRTINHLKSTRSLYIMCHIPVFCWMVAAVAEHSFDTGKMPRTLTQMYIRFLWIQTSIKKEKYTEKDEEIIFKLAKLACQQLERGNLIFYEEDLRECGIDMTEGCVYSGVCTQLLREEDGIFQEKVFSFVHLSIQEFLAALYVFLCFSKKERNMADQQQSSELSVLFSAATLHDLHTTAVDLSLKSQNGHLDLFLRFLLGLSLEPNQIDLKRLRMLKGSRSQTSAGPRSETQVSQGIVQFVKQKIREEQSTGRRVKMNARSSPDRVINLFYCLNELNQYAVVEEIERKRKRLVVHLLKPGEWDTKTFHDLRLPEEQLQDFDLLKYVKTPETDQTELLSPDQLLQKLLPACTIAFLENCSLTSESCFYLAEALKAPSSNLTKLDLSDNHLQDSGIEHLCSGLGDPNCNLKELNLSRCRLTTMSCSHLSVTLQRPSSSLISLTLCRNNLLDSGVELLCPGLRHDNCNLKELSLSDCGLTSESYPYLTSVLTSPSSRLTSLYLRGNDLSESEVEQLSILLKKPNKQEE